MDATRNEEHAPWYLLRALGRGGMGTVDLVARQEGQFQRHYALKRLRPEFVQDGPSRAAFLDEGRVMGFIYHPNVVRVFDVGEDEIGPYLLMEYVEGVTFGKLIHTCQSIELSVPLPVVIEITRDVARGLFAAHTAQDLSGRPLQVLHRDISPDNILVGRDGMTRVTDFGIAKALGRKSASTQNLLKGKIGYMAPERLRFEPATEAADLWSLGVVLLEALTEERLYHGNDAARRILHEPPPDPMELVPEAPAALVGLVISLLAKDPKSRPKDARAVARALDEILSNLTLGREPDLTIDFIQQVTSSQD